MPNGCLELIGVAITLPVAVSFGLIMAEKLNHILAIVLGALISLLLLSLMAGSVVAVPAKTADDLARRIVEATGTVCGPGPVTAGIILGLVVGGILGYRARE